MGRLVALCRSRDTGFPDQEERVFGGARDALMLGTRPTAALVSSCPTGTTDEPTAAGRSSVTHPRSSVPAGGSV